MTSYTVQAAEALDTALSWAWAHWALLAALLCGYYALRVVWSTHLFSALTYLSPSPSSCPFAIHAAVE